MSTPQPQSQPQPALSEYVLGFVFNNLDQVLLMKKAKPLWQRGNFNGVGGSINPGELTQDAMARESAEELNTAIPIPWNPVGIISGTSVGGSKWAVYVFAALYRLPIVNKELDELGQPREPVEWFSMHRLPENRIHNLDYLVPLSCESVFARNKIDFTIITSVK